MEPFFTTEQEPDLWFVKFQTPSLMNSLDLERISHALLALVDATPHRVILDFAKVDYLSSQAIGMLLTLNKRLGQEKDGRLVLCHVGPKLMELLHITKLDRVLNIRATRDEALEAARK